MPDAQGEAFLASLKRCLDAPGFLDSFYVAFLASSDEVRARFENTDFKRQVRVLADSLYALAVAAQGGPGSPAQADLPRLAERHSRRDLDIRPELYDQWLECLMATVRRFDPALTPELEAAWRRTLGSGIDYMRSRY
jgi:hemoglobin-like flavoprotein